jgi:hypothetical protein
MVTYLQITAVYWTYLLTELSPSWEAANCAATQELPKILWNPKFHYRALKSPPLVPILSQIDPVLLMNFRNNLIFYGEELLAPRPIRKLEDHPLTAVRDCLYNIFAATLHIWRPSPPTATWGLTMPWWQGSHLTWVFWTAVKWRVFPWR